MTTRILSALLGALLAAACASPETKRARGSGRGADLGYRGPVIVMHEGADPYHETPRLIEAKDKPADSAQRQANRR